MHEAVDEKPAIEYLDGRPYRKVSPRIAHAVVQSNMGEVLRRCVGDRGVVGTELHVYPGRIDGTQTVFVPDVAFVSWERIDALGAEREEPRSAEIAVEVRSPSNDLRFLEAKIARYLATGSLLVLDVDPQQRAILAHDPEGIRRFEAGQRFEGTSVPWLQFDVDDAFRNVEHAMRYER